MLQDLGGEASGEHSAASVIFQAVALEPLDRPFQFSTVSVASGLMG
jgi:hypothetical protein